MHWLMTYRFWSQDIYTNIFSSVRRVQFSVILCNNLCCILVCKAKIVQVLGHMIILLAEKVVSAIFAACVLHIML
jgi:hypothetical protein